MLDHPRRLRTPRHDPHDAPTLDQASSLLLNPNFLDRQRHQGEVCFASESEQRADISGQPLSPQSRRQPAHGFLPPIHCKSMPGVISFSPCRANSRMRHYCRAPKKSACVSPVRSDGGPRDRLLKITARPHPVELRFVAVCRLVPPNPSGPKSGFALQPRELKP